jgi:choline kinase
MEVGGMPLIGHALAHAEASGCRDAVVVVGYEGARVRAAVEGMRTPLRVRFVETADPTAPNGQSLLAAAPFVGPRFFLQMVDHVFGQVVLPLLEAQPPFDGEAGRLLIDDMPDASLDLDDATRVRRDGARITAIGKRIEPWDAIDTGCFVLTPQVFDALEQVPASEPKTVSSAMRRLAAAGGMFSAAIGQVAWVDVDTPADRLVAERVLSAAPARVR